MPDVGALPPVAVVLSPMADVEVEDDAPTAPGAVVPPVVANAAGASAPRMQTSTNMTVYAGKRCRLGISPLVVGRRG